FSAAFAAAAGGVTRSTRARAVQQIGEFWVLHSRGRRKMLTPHPEGEGRSPEPLEGWQQTPDVGPSFDTHGRSGRAAQDEAAWSPSRARLSVLPSTASTSKMPGEVVRPVRAARSGCATAPSLTPARSA